MANYLTNQFSYSHAQPEHLYTTVSFGASGAPTMVAKTGMGISSVVRNSAGNYSITLSHAYPALLMVNVKSISPSAAPAAPSSYIVSSAVTSSTAPVIIVQFSSIAGAATDPASGESVLLEVVLHKSSLPY